MRLSFVFLIFSFLSHSFVHADESKECLKIPNNTAVCFTEKWGPHFLSLGRPRDPLPFRKCDPGTERLDASRPTESTVIPSIATCENGLETSPKRINPATCKIECPAEQIRGIDGKQTKQFIEGCGYAWNPTKKFRDDYPLIYDCDPKTGWKIKAKIESFDGWTSEMTPDWIFKFERTQRINPVPPDRSQCRAECLNTCPAGYETVPKGDPRCEATRASSDPCESSTEKVDEDDEPVCCIKIRGGGPGPGPGPGGTTGPWTGPHGSRPGRTLTDDQRRPRKPGQPGVTLTDEQRRPLTTTPSATAGGTTIQMIPPEPAPRDGR